jgi:3-methylcrotonyl-CoA carboxylase alpha subunit
VRVDSGIASGGEVTVHYDPMLAKLIVAGEDRQAALERLRWALEHWAVLGVETNLPLLQAIATHPEFMAGHTFTNFLTKNALNQAFERPPLAAEVLLAAAALEVVAEPEVMPGSGAQAPNHRSTGHSVNERRPFNPWTQGGMLRRGGEQTLRYSYQGQQHLLSLTPDPTTPSQWDVRIVSESGKQKKSPPNQQGDQLSVVLERPDAHHVVVQIEEQRRMVTAVRRGYEVLVSWCGLSYRLEMPRPLDVDALAQGGGASRGAQQKLTAPMPGTIVKVYVREGERVEAHQSLLVLSAMKMEHAITAPRAAVVRRLPFAEGATVPGGATLIELGEDGVEETGQE